MCARSIALGGQWEGVEARGGARLSPGTFPTIPTRCCQHTLVYKKVTRFCLARHLWTSLAIGKKTELVIGGDYNVSWESVISRK